VQFKLTSSELGQHPQWDSNCRPCCMGLWVTCGHSVEALQTAELNSTQLKFIGKR